MSVSFGGIGEKAVTFEAASGVKAGYPVKMSANGQVTACSTGERMCGIALYVSDDGHATVQMNGYVNMPYSGSGTPAVGYGHLLAGADGTVQVEAADSEAFTGGEYLITDVDTTGKTVGFFM